MSLSPEPDLLLWLSVVTWPISAKKRALRKGDKDSDFLSAKSTTGLSRSDANEGNFPHDLFDPLQARASQARERGSNTIQQGCPEGQRTFRTVAHPPDTKTAGGSSLPCPCAHGANFSWHTVFLTSFFFFFLSHSNRNYKLQHEQCFI